MAVAFDDDDDDILEGAQHCFATVDDDEAYGDFENLDESDDDGSSSDDDAPAADEDQPIQGMEFPPEPSLEELACMPADVAAWCVTALQLRDVLHAVLVDLFGDHTGPLGQSPARP